MDFALWTSAAWAWPETLERSRWAERAGFAQLWVADHLMPNSADDRPDPAPLQECWGALTALGALVPRLRLVSMVSPTTWHHPVLLLKRAIQADHISGGRAALGLGAGWQVNEHAAYGLELPAPRERVDRFAEAIEIISRLRTEDTLDFAGEHFTLRGAPLSPKPIGALPIVVGTSGQRMLRLTARWADGWNTWAGEAAAPDRLADFHRACAAAGRDPATMTTSVQAIVVHTDDPVERRRWLEDDPPRGLIVGGSGELVDIFGRYRELGFDTFGINDGAGFGQTPTERAERLQRLADEVLARL